MVSTAHGCLSVSGKRGLGVRENRNGGQQRGSHLSISSTSRRARVVTAKRALKLNLA